MMEQVSPTTRDEAIEHVRKILSPTGRIPLLVALVGSHAKQLASSDSDWDVVVMTMHSSSRPYLLQALGRSSQIMTKLSNGTELDMTLHDILVVQKMIARRNMMAHFLFGGIVLFETPTAKRLREIWIQEAYQADALAMSFRGMLVGYKKKKLGIEVGATKTSRKLAVESLFIMMTLLFMRQEKRLPVPVGMDELVEKVIEMDLLRPSDGEWIKDLVNLRRTDKNAEYEMTDGFRSLVNDALLRPSVNEPMRDLSLAVKEMEEMFLALVQ